MTRHDRHPIHTTACLATAAVVALLLGGSGVARASSTRVNFGDISHAGLKDLGPASTGLKLSLEIGMNANTQGIVNVVKAASNPSSSSYGKYLSLSTLQSCCKATTGYDMTSGLGSPIADQIVKHLHH